MKYYWFVYVFVSSDPMMCDRYYSALYRKLLDAALQTTSRHAMFLNLLYKSLNKDENIPRIQVHLV
jgi:ribosome biogenesis protein MAK21